MLTLGALSFLNPWILAGLLTLPVLWWLLRAVPPSPRTQSFAGVRLLLGLEDEERQTDRTPWWLLLLRCVAIAAALLGLSQPVANLDQRLTGSGTLLLVLDQGWASAPDWTDRLTLARTVVDEADQAGRRIVIASGADATVSPVLDAEAARAMIGALEPRPWPVDRASLTEAIAALSDAPSETVWIHDGLDTEGADEMLALLGGLGPMRLVGPEQTVNAIAKPYLDQGQLKARVLRAAIGDESVQVIAMAESPEGGERRIAVADAIFDGAADAAEVSFNLPPELQGTVTRVMLSDRPTAGGSAMADGAIRRVIAGLVGTAGEKAVTSLISPTHYVEKALVPWADLVRGGMDEVLSREPATMILIDAGAIPDTEQQPLAEWVEAGGLLIRFAGPRLAASIGAQGFGSAQADDPFLPVRLRRGGRVLGGALAWTTPRTLGPFDQSGPFRGLTPPAEVDVRTQVLAEPSPDLAGKVWASLDDGTPLVTAKRMGDGHIVLFHVSSDAEWSSLPLSGLFVEMLGRLMTMAPGSNAGVADAEAMADTLWRPELLMNVDGV
ncbi:MAG: BatA domain-containing protein, partial [Pseudomonadota bacterium]